MLQYLHEVGVVHYDVKGQNSIVDRVPDFAKLVDVKAASTIFNAGECNRAWGVSLWMASQGNQGEQSWSKFDSWSLECTIIEMVTIVLPCLGLEPRQDVVEALDDP